MIRRVISPNGRAYGVLFFAATLLVVLRTEGVLESGWSFWLAVACLSFVTLVLTADAARGIWRRLRQPESE